MRLNLRSSPNARLVTRGDSSPIHTQHPCRSNPVPGPCMVGGAREGLEQHHALHCATLLPRKSPSMWLVASSDTRAATSASPSRPTSTQRVRVGRSDAAPGQSLGSLHAPTRDGSAASATSELRPCGSCLSWLLMVPAAPPWRGLSAVDPARAPERTSPLSIKMTRSSVGPGSVLLAIVTHMLRPPQTLYHTG